MSNRTPAQTETDEMRLGDLPQGAEFTSCGCRYRKCQESLKVFDWQGSGRPARHEPYPLKRWQQMFFVVNVDEAEVCFMPEDALVVPIGETEGRLFMKNENNWVYDERARMVAVYKGPSQNCLCPPPSSTIFCAVWNDKGEIQDRDYNGKCACIFAKFIAKSLNDSFPGENKS